MSLAESIKSVFSKYATFSGRARRSEFWWFVLANWVVSSVVYAVTVGPTVVPSMSNNGETVAVGASSSVYGLYSLALFLPALAVAVRRMHDVSKSGWYLLMALIPLIGWIFPLVAAVKEGDTGPNGYGPDPTA